MTRSQKGGGGGIRGEEYSSRVRNGVARDAYGEERFDGISRAGKGAGTTLVCKTKWRILSRRRPN